MTQTGGLYVAFTALLLLIALGVAIPVLKRIVIDGIERQRTGEATLRTDPDPDSNSDPDSNADDAPFSGDESSSVDPEGTRAVCADCETTNDPDFTYCRECGSRL